MEERVQLLHSLKAIEGSCKFEGGALVPMLGAGWCTWKSQCFLLELEEGRGALNEGGGEALHR
jgi:hypothetical protein